MGAQPPGPLPSRHHALVAEAGETTEHPDDVALLDFFRAIGSRDRGEVARRLDSSAGLAVAAIRIAASRHDAETYFLTTIRHYVFGGDTGRHIAAAAYARALLGLARRPRRVPERGTGAGRSPPLRR